ncbi:hybrid NRPS/PKS enzyme [Penicillium samsonianum]|uniref:hybrid NRPS/PKS enzyme n=1 Tax=Penicillium samsonianum TaxID=1882272 RepID=UPI0025490772|nr:hybrid NRPS/PKS enzyme [Penicillium samsonianum]KAJ6131816.1 hybrid NRPS/PKS enzyme [Penicillium samsonianum]
MKVHSAGRAISDTTVYLFDQSKAILPRFDRQSETDLHEMPAEAIVAGRPGSYQTQEQAAVSISVKDQLAAAEDYAECLVIVENCFTLALGTCSTCSRSTPNSWATTWWWPTWASTHSWPFGPGSGSSTKCAEDEGHVGQLLNVARMCDDVLVDCRRLHKA